MVIAARLLGPVAAIAAEDLVAAAEITRAPAALEAVAVWEAVVIAVAAIAAEEEEEEDSVAAVAAAVVVAAVAAVAEDVGDKRTIDGENNYEINNQEYDFLESIRDRGSDRHCKFLRVGIDRGAG